MDLFKKIGFFSALILPALVIAGYYGGGAWNLLPIGFVFVAVPIADYFQGIDTTNVPKEKKAIVGEEFFYRLITYLWVFVQLGILGWACFIIASTGLRTPFEWVSFTINMALVTGGIGITVAHELGHKKTWLEQFYSQLLLMTVCYMHFFIEHNRGHHVNVATPLDPATARKGQSMYAFWFQSTLGSWWHAWELESASLHRMHHSTWSIHNKMLHYTVLPLIFCAALTFFSSQWADRFVWEFPIFFFAQSVLAFTLLELVNYVEHYGIHRKEIASGQYERVNPLHSWNASHLISNFFLFQLQRHSDHHYNASKRYQILDHYDESPQLPYGYPTMILIALVPPLWFRVMNPRLKQWEEKTRNP